MGIVVSKNGGTTWTPIKISAQTGSESIVAAVAPSNANILYVGGVDSAWKALIYRSANGGGTWTAITNGISNQPQGIAVDPQDPNIVYIATYDAIWRSSNGGGSWTKCTFSSSAWGFKAVAVNKNNPNQVFVGCSHGVFYSQDRGLTWTDVSEGLSVPDVTQLYFNPANSTLYVGTQGAGLWKRTF
jgi:photosystem II stability/assembly factor-like uncharacterized protein